MAGVGGGWLTPYLPQHRIGDPFITCNSLGFHPLFHSFPLIFNFISLFSTGFPGFKRTVANPFAVEAEDPGWGFWPFSPDPGSIGRPYGPGKNWQGKYKKKNKNKYNPIYYIPPIYLVTKFLYLLVRTSGGGFGLSVPKAT